MIPLPFWPPARPLRRRPSPATRRSAWFRRWTSGGTALLLAAVLGGAMPSSEGRAAGDGDGKVVVTDAWARATASGQPGAVFLALHNQGSGSDRMVAAETGVARKVALRSHVMDKGQMRTRAILSIEVPPGSQVMLRPGGYQLELLGLTRTLQVGDKFPLKVRFAKSPPVTIDVRVAGPRAMSASGR